MKSIQLGGINGRDKVALVDDDMFDVLNTFRWHIVSGYAATDIYCGGGWKTSNRIVRRLWMHRLVILPPDGYEVDHIDGDTFRNTRANLRPATRLDNVRNTGLRRDNTSGYKGVSKRRNGRYGASIGVNGKSKHIGVFTTPEEAAVAYDCAAKDLFGDFGRLNF